MHRRQVVQRTQGAVGGQQAGPGDNGLHTDMAIAALAAQLFDHRSLARIVGGQGHLTGLAGQYTYRRARQHDGRAQPGTRADHQ